MACELCPRRCGVERPLHAVPGQGPGFCRMGQSPVIARAALHHWEEPCLSGTRGSGTVFFSGCTLRCVFCQNAVISQQYLGREITPQQLRQVFDSLVAQGAHNLNLVSPTPFLPAIQEALAGGVSVPVVMNSGGYERPETLKHLAGQVDVYLPDFKYADAALGHRLSGVPDYPQTALDAIDEMVAQTGDPRLDDDGMLIRGVMVRHLVLPNHLDNTFDALDCLSQRYGSHILISLMSQYIPQAAACDIPDLSRPLTADEVQDAMDYLSYCDFADGYVQTGEAASDAYIPPFETLEGVPQ